MASQFAAQLGYSALLIAQTTLIHALFIASGASVFRAVFRRTKGASRFIAETISLVLLSLWLMTAHVIEMFLWAGTFLSLELFATLEEAFYFAAVSYTTLGFGDVLLGVEWRLLSGAAAANGLLLFGLSAAFLIDAAARLRLGGQPDA